MANTNRKHKIWLVILIAIPIILWILPSDYFDNSDLILCPSRLLFNFECLGCGMTRAVMHFHHFEFSEAFYYNYLSVIVYPGLFIVWFIWMRKVLKGLSIFPFSKKS
jgi:hypothetical protein